MRILALFRGRLAESRGTPSRSRNLVATLAARDNDLLVLSGDPPGALDGVLAVPHRSLSDRPEERLAAAARQHRPELFYGQASKSGPLLLTLGAVAAPRVVDLHGDLAAEKLEQEWKPLPRRLASFARHRLEERRWLHRMDGFTAASATLARRVGRLGLPTEVVWGGVDPDLFKAPPPAGGDGVLVAYAGNFRPYQGLAVLVEAFAHLDDRFRLLLVGDPTGGEAVLERARRLLGDRLTVEKPVAYGRVPEVLGRADVLVVPRPDCRSARFGFPSKLPEYLALDRAVVVTDVGEQGRVVDDGKNGLVVPPGSPAHLAAALERLSDGELRRRLAAAGRRAAEGELSWARIGARLDSFLEDLLRRHRAGPRRSARGGR